VTPKGVMNRAHAYKAILQENQNKGLAGEDLDRGINMGLFSYPILMASDILIFKSDLVPVGKDQLQHLEITRDLAERFNHYYGPILKSPQGLSHDSTTVIPGLDGRKMSKSYQNTIPLFLPEKKLQKMINKIKTDSTPPEAPKNPDESLIFSLFQQFATADQITELKKDYQEGISWGEAKKRLFEVINHHLKGPRKHFAELIQNPQKIDALLKAGAKKARPLAQETLQQVTNAIGL
jgi:tryptophanyl-tRNA synthetase